MDTQVPLDQNLHTSVESKSRKIGGKELFMIAVIVLLLVSGSILYFSSNSTATPAPLQHSSLPSPTEKSPMISVISSLTPTTIVQNQKPLFSDADKKRLETGLSSTDPTAVLAVMTPDFQDQLLKNLSQSTSLQIFPPGSKVSFVLQTFTQNTGFADVGTINATITSSTTMKASIGLKKENDQWLVSFINILK
ncbi:MAG TPA: hypothetical protein VE090_04130 [Methylomirabilota bacterium]|nr:hypothetical protein [Methylomirabilota bacterium]